MVPVFLLTISSTSTARSILIALSIYILAAVTDWLDGCLARRMNVVSNFGKIADPLADKMLVLSALAVLTWASPFALPKVIFFVILAREIVITIMRELYQRRRIVVPADKLGKLKTFMQMVGVIAVMLLWARFHETTTTPPSWIIMTVNIWWWLVAGITLVSGMNYLINRQR